MTIGDLAPIYDSLGYLNTLIFIGVCFLGVLTLVECIRLVIVLYRATKGRMDRV